MKKEIILTACFAAAVVCGETFDLSDLIGYADNYDPKPVLTYEGSVDTTVCGTYPITYTITDKYGNATSHELEINVVDEKPEHTPSDSRTDFEEIKTKYKVLKSGRGMSLVEVELLTGRTHQIRVHLSHIGHVIAGDELYGGRTDLITRQALHAYHIEFTHPATGEYMKFETDIPEDIREAISKLQNPVK